jgi:crotonobetainyl-CoA:carnitine CoA-transferase CaiB-like acyl-CoA transferase
MQPAAVTWPGMNTEYAYPPKYGQHTRAVLGEAGFGDDEIAALAEQGVVAGV